MQRSPRGITNCKGPDALFRPSREFPSPLQALVARQRDPMRSSRSRSCSHEASLGAMQVAIERIDDPSTPWGGRPATTALIFERAWRTPDQRMAHADTRVSAITIGSIKPDSQSSRSRNPPARTPGQSREGRSVNGHRPARQSAAALPVLRRIGLSMCAAPRPALCLCRRRDGVCRSFATKSHPHAL